MIDLQPAVALATQRKPFSNCDESIKLVESKRHRVIGDTRATLRETLGVGLMEHGDHDFLACERPRCAVCCARTTVSRCFAASSETVLMKTRSGLALLLPRPRARGAAPS